LTVASSASTFFCNIVAKNGNNVEATFFDIVAFFVNNVTGFNNNVESNFVLSTKSKQIEHVHKLNMFSLFRLCRKDEILFNIVAETGNIVAKNGNNVEATFDIVERMKYYDKLVLHCCHFW